MDISRLNSVYFLGIGGIGMSAQALYLHHRGIRVAGYDRTSSRITDYLADNGIEVHFDENPDLIPSTVELVVVTPAIPSTNTELMAVKQKGIPVLKRSEMLGLITGNRFTIAVAGTHGKTTITAMISHILKTAGIPVTAFIGGISKNYGSNLIDDEKAAMIVVEADEYDRSFLHLNPDIAVISAMDPDHLDVYGSFDNMVSSYLAFAQRVRPAGYLVVNHALKSRFGPMLPLTASLSDPEADFHADGIRIVKGVQHFDLHLQDRTYADLVAGIPGRFNTENATLAIAAATIAGISEEAIRKAVKSFTGVERRFDFRVLTRNRIYLDDYAHHPREIEACIRAIRELFPEMKLTVVFQPHLFSRTRDLVDDFAHSLALADELVLLDIYPAREEPIPGVTSALLLEKVPMREKTLCSYDSVKETIRNRKPQLLMSLGAGDIDGLIRDFEEVMNELPQNE